MIARDIVRSGALAAVSPRGWVVYTVLLDYLWRSSLKGSGKLKEAVAAGELAASVSKAKIAELTGISDRSVQRALVELEGLGWVRRKGILFVLGRVVEGAEDLFAGPGGDRSVSPTDPVGGDKSVSLPAQGETDLSPLPTPQRETDLSPFQPEGRQICLPQTGTGGRQICLGGGDRSVLGGETDLSPPSIRLRNNGKEKLQARKSWLELEHVEDRSDPPSAEDRSEPERPPAVDRSEPERRPRRPSLVSDPKRPERQILRTEADALEELRRKLADPDRPALSGREILAGWRSRYFLAFGLEDVDLATEAAQSRLARMLVVRIARWAAGDSHLIRNYLDGMIALWRDRKPDAKFPSTKVPRLESLLRSDKSGPALTWKNWSAGGRTDKQWSSEHMRR